MEAILAYPLTPSVLSISTIVLALGFTPPGSPLRPLGLIPMIGCVQLSMHAIQVEGRNINTLRMSIILGSTTGMLMQYLDSVLLSRWSYEAQGPTSGLGGQKPLRTPSSTSQPKGHHLTSTFASRLRFGWEEAFRARSTRTPWQVNHVPYFFPDRPKMVPTKTQFLYRMASELLLSVLILDVISFMGQGQDTSMNAVYFASSQVPIFTRLRNVTIEEVIVRFMASIVHWVATICLLQVMYDGAAIVVIALGLGRIERWPPLFNSWTECWSVRQFWG